MSNHDKNKTIYTKEQLIKAIASDCDMTVDFVRRVYNSFEDKIAHLLSTANEQTDVVLRPFSGISISGTFVPEHTKMNYLKGELVHYPDKIKPKASITRRYCEKINGDKK